MVYAVYFLQLAYGFDQKHPFAIGHQSQFSSEMVAAAQARQGSQRCSHAAGDSINATMIVDNLA